MQQMQLASMSILLLSVACYHARGAFVASICTVSTFCLICLFRFGCKSENASYGAECECLIAHACSLASDVLAILQARIDFLAEVKAALAKTK